MAQRLRIDGFGSFRAESRMTTVGILGGGQLARMLALAGAPLGVRFLTPIARATPCAGQVAPLIAADWRDFDALAGLAGTQRRGHVRLRETYRPIRRTGSAEHTKAFPNARALGDCVRRIASPRNPVPQNLASRRRQRSQPIDSRD
mgnify:CR=1 FL=1